ncbi:PREDICTED: uncharacterized protein LOC108753976 [Trachymyrmex septentrionalis]|uniref:uncharacterized protein LOC108753976 n=1 Tax=Trachymyrmex septentrionalis TaxID=34720 RepID=UPI00084F4466|nr:PREDICTED: uncharacterized protein LOC108753976 [Trachymyrmex septentrionalis]
MDIFEPPLDDAYPNPALAQHIQLAQYEKYVQNNTEQIYMLSLGEQCKRQNIGATYSSLSAHIHITEKNKIRYKRNTKEETGRTEESLANAESIGNDILEILDKESQEENIRTEVTSVESNRNETNEIIDDDDRIYNTSCKIEITVSCDMPVASTSSRTFTSRSVETISWTLSMISGVAASMKHPERGASHMDYHPLKVFWRSIKSKYDIFTEK